MSNVENEEQSNKNNKKSFFKDVLKSIKDFDKYEDFLMDKMIRNVVYLSKIVAIFTLVITIISTYKFSQTLNSVITYFNNNITELVYENGKVSINENQKFETNVLEDLFGKITIDTSDLNDEEIENYKSELENKNNEVILLKDKILIKNEMLAAIKEVSYSNLIENGQDIKLDKEGVLNYFLTNQINIYLITFIMLYFYTFIVYLFSTFLDAVILAVMGYIIAKIIKLNIRFEAALKLGVHALTLPIILNIIYVLINGLTGFVVKYFSIMYTSISYIYIITAIFMIKSDYIKRKIELQKIQSQQAQINMELEKEKQKEEDENTEKKNKEEKNKQKEKEGKSDDNKGQNPEGSNA